MIRPPRTAARRRARGLKVAGVASILLAIAAFLGFGQAAFAQDPPLTPVVEGPEVTLMSIDAVDDPVVILRKATRPADVEILVAAEPATVSSIVPAADSERGTQTVLVIDNGAAAAGVLDSFIAAARDYVNSAPAGEQISIWSTGGTARLRAGMTDDRARLDAIVSNLVSASGTNHMWDAIRGATIELEDTAVGFTNVIVFAGSPDTESVTSSTEARGAVLASKASAFVVSSDDPAIPLDSLARLTAVTPAGGFAATGDLDTLAAYGSSVSDVVAGTWVVEFHAANLFDENQIDVNVDGTILTASYLSGSVASGAALAPFRPGDPGGLSFLRGDTGRLIGLVAGALAAGLGAYALVMLFQKDMSGLSSTLMPYSGDGVMGGDDPTGRTNSISKNLFVKRAVELTEGLAERQGMMSKSEALLERADMPLRVGEALTAYAAIVMGSAVLGLLLGKTVVATLIVATLGILLPPMVVRMKAARRRKKFMSQLPDTLQLLSSTLKAGYSFMQGIDAVSQEIENPMASELRRVVAEAQLGRPVEDAMDASAERMDSNDFAWAVMAVKIQREVGGNLSELLMTVAETMKERESLRRDVSALTAEGKMSAIVLGALPILLGFVMWAMNPEYIEILFTHPIGKILLVVSVIAALGGFAWMKKIITIDI